MKNTTICPSGFKISTNLKYFKLDASIKNRMRLFDKSKVVVYELTYDNDKTFEKDLAVIKKELKTN